MCRRCLSLVRTEAETFVNDDAVAHVLDFNLKVNLTFNDLRYGDDFWPHNVTL